MMPGFVYVLSNPAMPGIIKIGKTTQDDVNVRMAQLYSTGVPVPFTLEFAGKVENPDEVESALHLAFSPSRINPKREFFKLLPEQAIAILKLLHTEEATAHVASQPTGIDQQSIAAAEQLSSRRPNLNFEEMGIPIGAELKSTRDDTTVVVTAPKKVRFNDDEMSLTTATRLMMGVDYNLSPSGYWTYNGQPLWEIYEKTYSPPA